MKVLRITLLLLMLFSLTTAICYGQTAEDYFDKGTAYLNKGMLDEAIAEYKKAIEINPNDAMAHNNLGLAYLGLVYLDIGMYDKAIAEFKKAIKVSPEYADADNNLAVAYYYKGEYSLAIKHCDRAIDLGYRVDRKLLEDLKPYRKVPVVIEKIYATPDRESDTPKMSFRPGDSICLRIEYVFSEIQEGTSYVVEGEVRDSNNELLVGLSKKSEYEKKWDRTTYTGLGTIPKDAQPGTYTFIGKVKVGSFVAEKQAEFKVETRED